MKYLVLLLLGLTYEIRVPPVSRTICNEPQYFLEAYNHLRSLEGYYVNHPADKGGETYAGITKKYNKNWHGWRYIKNGKYNQKFDKAEFWVLDYYLTIWVREGFDKIRDRDLAINLFEFRAGSSPRTVEKKVNIVLNQMGLANVNISEGWVDERFNTIDPDEFILRLKIQRLKLFTNLVLNDSTQKQFYKGWLRRINV